jgi:suppressor of ftsI
MVLADLVQPSSVQPGSDHLSSDHISSDQSSPDREVNRVHASDGHRAFYKPVHVEALKKAEPDFTVTFTEDKNGFYINDRKYAPDASPITTVRVGTYQHWRIVNRTAELHPFHIHQVHFLAYAENGVPFASPAWLDTVNVPYGGTVDVIVDFTNPIIKGIAVFHCHLLNHEDKGMMAKILFK